MESYSRCAFVTDFFHLEKCFQGLCVLQPVSILPFSLFLNSLPLFEFTDLFTHVSVDGHFFCFNFWLLLIVL